MAIHTDKYSMLKESLPEMLEVAEYCISFDKSKDARWPGKQGCYGYPATILLLCIVDSIGSIVKDGGNDVSKHFEILNDPNYYALALTTEELNLMKSEYRNRLTHNTYMRPGVWLDIGNSSEPVLESVNGDYFLRLKPFLNISKKAVKKLLNEI